MKHVFLVVATVATLATTGASAQSANLTGVYRCIQMCRGDLPAYVTQNGPELNLLTEAGVPSRAWPDWFYPATRIWIDAFNIGAVYSPDGLLIQFDNGTIWQRDLPPPPPPLRRRR
jgi:hypothetical protein